MGGQVSSQAWYLQWYVMAGVAFFLYGLAYAWYFALGGVTPVEWVKNRLKRRRQAKLVIEQEAARVARQKQMRLQAEQLQRQPAGSPITGGPITIDAEPE